MTGASTPPTLELVKPVTAREMLDEENDHLKKDEDGANWRAQRCDSLPAGGADWIGSAAATAAEVKAVLKQTQRWADGRDRRW